MNLESKVEFEVQGLEYVGTNNDGPRWESFRSFDTEQEALDYAFGEMNVRVVKRTVVTIKGEWEVVQ